MDLSFLSHFALTVLGAAIALVGTYLKSLTDRDTHASNRIFELRLEALDRVWQRFIDLKLSVGTSAGPSFDEWMRVHQDDARRALNAFRNDVDRAQIILDAEVIQAFRRLDTAYFQYIEGELHTETDRRMGFGTFIETQVTPLLESLSSVTSRHLDTNTHSVQLKLRT